MAGFRNSRDFDHATTWPYVVPAHHVLPVEFVEISADSCDVLRRGQPAQLEAFRDGVGFAPDQRPGVGHGELVLNVRGPDPDGIDKTPQRVHRLLLADAANQQDCLFHAGKDNPPRAAPAVRLLALPGSPRRSWNRARSAAQTASNPRAGAADAVESID